MGSIALAVKRVVVRSPNRYGFFSSDPSYNRVGPCMECAEFLQVVLIRAFRSILSDELLSQPQMMVYAHFDARRSEGEMVRVRGKV